MVVQTDRRCLDVNLEELQQALERARAALGEESYAKLRTGLEALGYLQELVADQDMTMAELRRLVHVHGGTEKTRLVLRRAGLIEDVPHEAQPIVTNAAETPRSPAPGHGRHGAAAYVGRRADRRPASDLAGGSARVPSARARQALCAAGAQAADPVRRSSAADGHDL